MEAVPATAEVIVLPTAVRPFGVYEYVNAPVPPVVWFVIVICWFISVDETFGVTDTVGSGLTMTVASFDVPTPLFESVMVTK